MDERSQALFDRLLQSKKYGAVCRDTLQRVAEECSARHKKPKESEKAAKEKLHGITGAFLTPAESKRLYRRVEELQAGDEYGLTQILEQHASTRERLPLATMDALYARIFEITEPPRRILDLACGLNPVYLSVRLPEDCRIVGVDIQGECVHILNEAIGSPERIIGIHADLLSRDAIPSERFDVALMFKILPLLDRQKAGAAMDVMAAVNARYLVISYPTRTLGGRDVGMMENYAAWMADHMPDNRIVVDQFVAGNELFYILKEN